MSDPSPGIEPIEQPSVSLKPLIVDAHQDLAYNMHTFGRDYRQPISETRRREQNSEVMARNGATLLGWPEYQTGRVAAIFATLFAAPARRKEGDWDTQCYRDGGEARTLYRRQMDTYWRLTDEDPDKFRLLHTVSDLDGVLADWQIETAAGHPVGLVVLMEGAECVGHPAELEEWWELGVRVLGPAWAGTRFCGGTDEPGPLTREGYALLDVMGDLGFMLDISHMDERAALQALDQYPGTIVATHSNAARLIRSESNRHLTDRTINQLLDRDGVIGIVPFNDFLRPDWRFLGGRESVTLEDVIAQIDYICQMAGDAHHVGLGTDFDGGFGLQSVPAGIEGIADLQKLVPLLLKKGYEPADIERIMGWNWIAKLQETLPATV